MDARRGAADGELAGDPLKCEWERLGARRIENWGCGIDVDRLVTTYRDGDVYELWRVPNFPDLDGAVRLAADIQEEVGRDAAHNYYLDHAQALHSVDIVSGVDEVLKTGVVAATGGATGTIDPWELTGPTRLLVLAGGPDEAAGVYLYRGEFGDMVRLADALPTDLPEPPHSGWAWRLDGARTYLYYLPSKGSEPYARVFDLDGAPLVFPAGVRAKRLSATGVLGSVVGPQGAQWVFARPGETEATVIDLAWDPALSIPLVASEELYWFQGERLFRTPLDGGSTIEVLDFGYHYTADDALMKHDDQLLHVDWNTNEVQVLVEGVGAYALVGGNLGEGYTIRGVFYTDISSPKRPSLWYMPVALLPGGS